MTFRSPLPAFLVSTLKSATWRTRTPRGCRPLPVARQALGVDAETHPCTQSLVNTITLRHTEGNVNSNVSPGINKVSFIHFQPSFSPYIYPSPLFIHPSSSTHPFLHPSISPSLYSSIHFYHHSSSPSLHPSVPLSLHPPV